MEDGRLTDLLSWLPGRGAGRRTSSAAGGAPASSSVALGKHRARGEILAGVPKDCRRNLPQAPRATR